MTLIFVQVYEEVDHKVWKVLEMLAICKYCQLVYRREDLASKCYRRSNV